MRLIKRQLLWVLVVVPLFPSCQPLEDPAKTIEDLLKRFTGLIDQVGVWNRALSAEEMAFLASPEVNINIKPGSDPNCINPD
ncbi:MAG: hypothetical protein GTO63_31390, partial [Anaerolineae bacterium]|nr:hypothetical protein [Anaerolineae bacterium]NIN99196.1 hypothetical protein [Anaerolineae bacterium]NIQ82037.1 hypothetical protein [Anaerolineae bacterium]